LVHFVVIRHIFPRVGILYQKNLATLPPVSFLESNKVWKISAVRCPRSVIISPQVAKSSLSSMFWFERDVSTFRHSLTGWPDWANFRLLGDCFRRQILKIKQGAQIICLLYSIKKLYVY
jgi:hypothetical protein